MARSRPSSKRCPGCGETKELTEFHKDITRPNGHSAHCKPCALASVRATRERARAACIAAGGGRCMDCGEERPWVLEFHHRDPSQKDFNIGRMFSLKRMLAEVAKCDLVCASCHRHRHYLMDCEEGTNDGDRISTTAPQLGGVEEVQPGVEGAEAAGGQLVQPPRSQV